VPDGPKRALRPRYAGGMPTEFRLRFPLKDVRYWADRYAYADDSEVEVIGEAAGAAGCYTRDQFLRVAKWKSPRSQPLCAKNADSSVREATARALSTTDERERVRVLGALHGVQLPTASVLLHLARGADFPIIDYRALWSLGVDEAPNSYSFVYWWAYTQACRHLAAEAGESATSTAHCGSTPRCTSRPAAAREPAHAPPQPVRRAQAARISTRGLQCPSTSRRRRTFS